MRLTPLRSIRHHNLAVNPASPPATTDDGISFDKAAGLKRFHSHSLAQRAIRWRAEKFKESDSTEEFDVLLGASLQETALLL